ncbi:MAG: c-type cytochrome, partial [Paracoccaceae bacterium]
MAEIPDFSPARTVQPAPNWPRVFRKKSNGEHIMRQHAAMAVLLGATALGACTPPEAQVGRAIYQENCVVCHGPAGKGDG